MINTTQWPMIPLLHNWNNIGAQTVKNIKNHNWNTIASIVLTYPNWCAARIHPLSWTFFMALKMYCPFLYMISSRIFTWTSTRCRPIKFTSLGCCWHYFLTRVKEGDLMKEMLLIWKKPKDVQDWNRPMERVRWTRGIFHEDADPLILVISR